MTEVKVWDWPVRLLHWLMVFLFTGLILTGKAEEDYLEWHFYMGYAFSAVVIARLLYGFSGSLFAQFHYFLTGPRTVFRYLQSMFNRKKDTYLSHNPIGALMVVCLLLLSLIQSITGLVNSDDVFWFGPFYEWLDSDWQERLSAWHYWLADVLLMLVGLHVLAVFVYEIAFKERLIKAMITGKKIITKPVSEELAEVDIKTPRLGVLISLGLGLCWLIWLYSLPI